MVACSISSSKKRAFQFICILFLILLLPLGCNNDEEVLSPQTQQECLDNAFFGDPSESPWYLPFAIDSSYLLTQSYCSGTGHSHESRFAYDFQMPFGTEILAARAGTVVELREYFSDKEPRGGHENMVCLKHEDETISLYIHMKYHGVDVELGDFVPRGGLLGWIGTSGTSFAHLHFQICERPGMCSYPDKEFTMPVNFRNAEGMHDERGGLLMGEYYKALPWN